MRTRDLRTLLPILAAVAALAGCVQKITVYTAPCCRPGEEAPAGPDPNRCVAEALTSFDPARCAAECAGKSQELSGGTGDCPALCARVREQVAETARRTCQDDPDGDGVQTTRDRCPATAPGLRVDSQGCPDADGDRTGDRNDRCPDTPPGRPVDHHGCEVVAGCAEGSCDGAVPGCRTPEECERQKETPLSISLPPEARHQLVANLLSRRPHPLRCPSDVTPPPQPAFTSPAGGMENVRVDPVVVMLNDGQVVAGSERRFELAWEPVTDPCGPVTYSIYVEHYHCHRVGDLVELASYRNRGWCRWMPYLYESVVETRFGFDFPYGKVLWDIHQPFREELRWSARWGPLSVIYRPFWLRLRVLAHDGNGNPSRFGVHAERRYIALYFTDEPAAALTEIPVTPQAGHR